MVDPEPKVKPDETRHIVWPGPPETARIEFVEMFSYAEDLGMRTSFSKKIQSMLTGSDENHMVRPYSVAVSARLIAVADPGAPAVHLFDKQNKTYHALTSAGEHRFVSPIGVALSDDRLFIADSGLSKVFILNRRFKLLMTLENFQRPTSLAYDPKRQRLYVTDTPAHEIQVYSQNGELLFTIGERGDQQIQFNFPSHLAFNKDRLFVNDTMNFRIQVLNPDGQHLGGFGKHGSGSGYFAQPKGVAVDSEGHIYVAEALSNQVQIFDDNAKFLLGFGNSGEGPGSFRMPTGLAIWGDMIYVADSYNQRVQVFRYLRKEN
jgi:DNA-binding beta-propeller fold protein YncE